MGQGSIIGYEINEKTCQISFYNEKDLEPDTLEVDTDQLSDSAYHRKTARHVGVWKRSEKTCYDQRRIYRNETSKQKSCWG